MISRLKTFVKAGRDGVLAALVRGRVAPPAGSLSVLTYHRVLPVAAQAARRIEPGMIVDPDVFAMHLRMLKAHFTPIRLGDWINLRSRRASNGKRFVAVTFDDGWQDNYRYAFDVLKANEFPASVFVVVDAIDQRLRFWTEMLADMYFDEGARAFLVSEMRNLCGPSDRAIELLTARPSEHGLSLLIEKLKNFPDAALLRTLSGALNAACNADAVARQDAEREFMNWSEVEEMAESGVVDFGSHSMTHLRLDESASDESMRREVVASRQVLKERLGASFNDIFCYPNGDVGGPAAELVRSTYKAACTTAIGVNSISQDMFKLKRINMHNDKSKNASSFLARLGNGLLAA